MNRDEIWKKLNDDAFEHAARRNWGLYTNVFWEMAQFLKKEGNRRRELDFLLLILFLEANGPFNVGGAPDKMLQEVGVSDFMPEDRVIPPAIAARVKTVSAEEGINQDELRKKFMSISEQYLNSRMPVTPSEAWEILKPYF